MAAAPKKKIELYSNEFFGVCAVGGALACGLTHAAMTPIDLVKCNIQANPAEFNKGLGAGLKLIYGKRGFGGLMTGWGPTLVGYSIQGSVKFGLYDYFKYKFATFITPQQAYAYRDLLYVSASASAEFFADMGLSAFEAVKVRVQTTLDPKTLAPSNFKGLMDGIPKIVQTEGVGALYAGLPPLWMRQIPYTVVKFLGFERAVEMIYKSLPKKKEEYNAAQQLAVTFAGGYIAGVFCAAVSHPADNVVSKLNKDKTATVSKILKETSTKDLLTKGLSARIIMIGTLTGLQWFIYDGFKKIAGLPTAGAKPPATATPAPSAVAAAKPAVAAPAAAAPAKAVSTAPTSGAGKH